MSAISLTVDVLRSFREPGAPTAPGARPATPPPDAIGPPVPLPAAAAPRPGLLAEVLTHRRAIRHFRAEPVDLATLLGAVADGMAADRARWPGEHPLIPVLVAQHVAGLPPAVYRLDPGGATATPVMALAGRAAYEELTLQKEFATAGAIVSLLGDLDAADSAHGGAGYRTLMTRAGGAGYQMWLSAISHGLVGSVFAGFLPAAVRTPLRCDGVTRHQLFALAVGPPGADPSTSAGTGPADVPQERG
ncbi:nitroreductase family protein [Longispora sp. NPDC051575]|uniref:nitroreductase family protein n=1 Tax=Longispora sp. NPDC051575 TaxID=3154943 RepID=UPI00344A3D04